MRHCYTVFGSVAFRPRHGVIVSQFQRVQLFMQTLRTCSTCLHAAPLPCILKRRRCRTKYAGAVPLVIKCRRAAAGKKCMAWGSSYNCLGLKNFCASGLIAPKSGDRGIYFIANYFCFYAIFLNLCY
jgi:hypothetical protein